MACLRAPGGVQGKVWGNALGSSGVLPILNALGAGVVLEGDMGSYIGAHFLQK